MENIGAASAHQNERWGAKLFEMIPAMPCVPPQVTKMSTGAAPGHQNEHLGGPSARNDARSAELCRAAARQTLK